MNIQQYISSGVIESYVLGIASPDEVIQLERLLPFYPPLQEALTDFEFQLELFSIQNEEPPPPGTFLKIQDRMREAPAIIRPAIRPGGRGTDRASEKQQHTDYIPVDGSSTHIRVHKYWRWAFIAFVILCKLLLAASIYYYIQYQHSKKDVRLLEQQTKAVHAANSTPASGDNDPDK